MSSNLLLEKADGDLTELEKQRGLLRLAALQSRKSGPGSKHATSSKETLAPPTDHQAEIPSSSSISTENLQGKSASSEKPLKHSASSTMSKRNHNRSYWDVDMPTPDSSDTLSSLSYDQQMDSPVPQARTRRSRISYADEFGVRPSAPSGELGLSPWMDLPLDTFSGPSYHTNPKRFPTRRATSVKSPSLDPHAIAKSLTQDTFAKFVNRPMQKPMVIEWSDDESDPGYDDPAFSSHTPSLGKKSAKEVTTSSSSVSSVVITEKEREIQTMLARIRELEDRRQSHTSSNTINTRTNAATPPDVLGKRTDFSDDEELDRDQVPKKARKEESRYNFSFAGFFNFASTLRGFLPSFGQSKNHDGEN
ncbi:hypothetical protein MYAM1_001912 [Malassezia yamatoensis]|uniref:Uncharacterized protein n=1 Tax=Malassezia yamatoensis TaxID=253288 RepID=A0AAJ5YTQ9_9BASI|nr:hypothetical protein MYAM1_001912 [Malassezia yamatoensis]